MITLAIESAIAGGSLSLMDGSGKEIANWVGENSDAARSEHLVGNIEDLLRANNVSKIDLGLIAVSAGPGSFTGIRIGMATAIGLKNGLGIPMSSTSALGAMVTAKGYLAYPSGPPPTTLLFFSAVPTGRNAICVQSFELGDWSRRELSAPWTMKEAELATFIDDQVGFRFLLHSDLVNKEVAGPRVTDIGRNLALCVGHDCFANRPLTPPLFVSKSF